MAGFLDEIEPLKQTALAELKAAPDLAALEQTKGAWTGPGALAFTPHAMAPVAELPVLEIISATHIIADLTLGLGKVVHDYLE